MMKSKLFPQAVQKRISTLQPIDFTEKTKGKKFNRKEDVDYIQGYIFKYNLSFEMINLITYYMVKVQKADFYYDAFKHLVEEVGVCNIMNVEDGILYMERNHEHYTHKVSSERREIKAEKTYSAVYGA